MHSFINPCVVTFGLKLTFFANVFQQRINLYCAAMAMAMAQSIIAFNKHV